MFLATYLNHVYIKYFDDFSSNFELNFDYWKLSQEKLDLNIFKF
jgi:hypothetical protein